jgi:hypothetical protein
MVQTQGAAHVNPHRRRARLPSGIACLGGVPTPDR